MPCRCNGSVTNRSDGAVKRPQMQFATTFAHGRWPQLATKVARCQSRVLMESAFICLPPLVSLILDCAALAVLNR
jgi:hypothetical protein